MNFNNSYNNPNNSNKSDISDKYNNYNHYNNRDNYNTDYNYNKDNESYEENNIDNTNNSDSTNNITNENNENDENNNNNKNNNNNNNINNAKNNNNNSKNINKNKNNNNNSTDYNTNENISNENRTDDENHYDNENIVHISSQLSSKMIVELMDEYPDLKKITCPPSLYKRISKKYLEVLEELGIIVEIKHNWGSKKKYNDEKREEVINLIKEGQKPSQIAEKLNLPIKTIYYLKNSNKNEKLQLKRGKKSKYSDATITKVKNLSKSGISPKKISKQEKIPLRTVYYIINKK